MDDHPQDTTPDPTDGHPVFEFEAESRGTVIETFRIALPDAEELDDEELADLLEDELAAGKAEFVARVTDEEHDRNLKRDSVLRL